MAGTLAMALVVTFLATALIVRRETLTWLRDWARWRLDRPHPDGSGDFRLKLALWKERRPSRG